MSKNRLVYLGMAIVLLVILSCNIPAPVNAPSASPTTILPITGLENLADTATLPPSPSAPSETPTYAVTHLMTPGNVSLAGNINYDVESQSNASLHRAPYGDVYRLNRLERPFTQTDMTYLPNIDIERFRITTDTNWDYVFIELIGTDPNDPLNIHYGVELDQNKDGFGEYLIWAQPPYATTWTTSGVTVYADANHDSAGLSAEQSDAPFSGNGYEKVIFDQGKGDDPDLAWVRIDPKNANTVEFAFKNTLPGKTFMWSVWADAGMKDLAKFSYNDRYTIEEAGSPQTDNLNYPIKALYAMDSTCRAAFGFKSNGYEPLICPTEAPPTREPGHPVTPGLPPPPACQPPPYCTGTWYIWHQDTCTCEEILY